MQRFRAQSPQQDLTRFRVVRVIFEDGALEILGLQSCFRVHELFTDRVAEQGE
jgi:hypothetical protein